eukprot:1159677-Pelagomonas_calceolata.AAC.3
MDFSFMFPTSTPANTPTQSDAPAHLGGIFEPASQAVNNGVGVVLALLVSFVSALCRQALQVYKGGVEQLDVLLYNVGQLAHLHANVDVCECV